VTYFLLGHGRGFSAYEFSPKTTSSLTR